MVGRSVRSNDVVVCVAEGEGGRERERVWAAGLFVCSQRQATLHNHTPYQILSCP